MKITNASFLHDIAMLLKTNQKNQKKPKQTNQSKKPNTKQPKPQTNKQNQQKPTTKNTTVRYFYIMTTFLSQNEFLSFQFV